MQYKNVWAALALVLSCSWNFGYSQDKILFRDAYPLPDIINSSAEEIQPVFDPDSSHLYFVRAFHEENLGYKENDADQDIWVATKDANGQWSSVKNVKTLNNKENNGVFGLSSDANTIYLLNAYLKKRKQLEKGVAIADKKGKDDWEHKPDALKIENFNLKGDHYSFHISETEDILIMSYEGKNSLGMEDLYVSKKDDKGNWHEPLHLGNTINSAGYEISPFLTPNADTLYFATDGRDGFGDADIYYSVRLDDTWQNWTEPQNLGTVINSASFDAYFIIHGKDVYFCSNREGNNQIYHTHMYIPPPPPILFNILSSTDPTTVNGNEGTITLNNLEPSFSYDKIVFFLGNDSTIIEDVVTNSKGEYTVENLPEGTYDKFRAYFDDFIATCPDEATLEGPEEVVEVDPPKQTIEDMVLFDLNSSYLNGDAKIKLNKLIPKIKEFGSYEILIEAHTDKRASDSYNKWLSERRLARVKDYLVSKGLSASSISGKYYGEEDPIHDCEDCEEDKHSENRRAEIKVTKK